MTELEIHKALLSVNDRDYLFVLGLCRAEGFELPLQGPIAFVHLENAANGGSSEAQFALAKLLSVGLFVKQDKSLAFEWCKRAASANFPRATTMLGSFHESGWGGAEVDLQKAVEYWRSAASSEEPGAMCALAGMHLDGRFLERDRDAGLRLLRAAASKGDPLAQCELGILLVDEEDPALESEALHLLHAAAENGISTAHRQLGHFHREGLHGLSASAELARSHFRTAAQLDEKFL
jgi:TPR repeat protein